MTRREACTALVATLGLSGIKAVAVEPEPEPLAFVLTLPEELPEADVARIRRKFEQEFQGMAHLPVVVLQPGMKFEVARKPT